MAVNQNNLLENCDYIRSLKYKDMYYLENLFFKVASFLKNVPVPIHVKIDEQNMTLIFSIGTDHLELKVDTDISYYDYITLIKQWAYNFYPKYEIDYPVEVELDKEEIIKLVKEHGVKVSDAMDKKKIVIQKQTGFIEKVFIREDQFLLNCNDNEREIRLSTLPLSTFMRSIREYKNMDETHKNQYIYDYIYANSRLIKKMIGSTKTIPVMYSGKQMYNFFVINYQSLKNYELTYNADYNFYLWKNFKIVFDSDIVKNDCLSYYNKMKEKEN